LDRLNYIIINVSGCNNMFLAVNKFNTWITQSNLYNIKLKDILCYSIKLL
jgi:hypothetical protein